LQALLLVVFTKAVAESIFMTTPSSVAMTGPMIRVESLPKTLSAADPQDRQETPCDCSN
jgi:hypothetical protein